MEVKRRRIQFYVSAVVWVLVACVGTWQISTSDGVGLKNEVGGNEHGMAAGG
jgi:hypothetical protein